MGTSGNSSSVSYRGTRIRRVNWSSEFESVRRLFQDYRQWLADHRDTTPGGDSSAKMGLEMLDKQIAELPGAFGPPRGEVFLAFAKGDVVACGALRELEPKVAEI